MPNLPSRRLGRTDLTVTRLGYGAMELRGARIWNGRQVSEADAARILDAVLEAGISFIDTAGDYGQSEDLIGRVLAQRRDRFALATKVGCKMTATPFRDQDEVSHIWTRDHLLWNIDASLEKLRTDHVEVLQLHNATVGDVQHGRLIEVLNEIRAAGKTRWIGASSVSPHLGTFINQGVFDTFQVPYSALERTHENLLERSHAAGAGTIVRGGVARGEPGLGRGPADRWALFERANLDELRDEGESRTQWLLRFTLSHPGVDTVIVGTLSAEHLQDNVRAAEAGPLSDDVYVEAKRRLDAAGEQPA